MNFQVCSASLLIAAGAVSGRLRMYRYLVLGLLFVPCYMLNEWIVPEGGLSHFRSDRPLYFPACSRESLSFPLL